MRCLGQGTLPFVLIIYALLEGCRESVTRTLLVSLIRETLEQV